MNSHMQAQITVSKPSPASVPTKLPFSIVVPHEEHITYRGMVGATRLQCTRLGEPHAVDHAVDVLQTAIRAQLLRPNLALKDGFSRNLTRVILAHIYTGVGSIPQELLRASSPEEKRLREEFVEAVELSLELRPYSSAASTEIARCFEALNDPNIPQRVKMLFILQQMADGMALGHAITDKTLPRQPNVFPEIDDWSEAAIQAAIFLNKVVVPFADRYGATAAYRRLASTTTMLLHPDKFAQVTQELAFLHECGAIQRTNQAVNSILRRTSNRLGMTLRFLHMKSDMSQLDECEIGVVERSCKSAGTSTAKMLVKGFDTTAQISDLVARFLIVNDVTKVYQLADVLNEEIMRELDSLHLPLDSADPIIFTDYYANQKPNGYRSLHMDVRTYTKLLILLNFEFIIRTVSDHVSCDLGGAAHDVYKNGGGGEINEIEMAGFKRLLLRIAATNGWHKP